MSARKKAAELKDSSNQNGNDDTLVFGQTGKMSHTGPRMEELRELASSESKICPWDSG